MKGVILGLAPRARIIDLTHEIAQGDIRSGAFALAASYAFFPRGAIHLAVVDPGVGTQRRGIAVQTANYFFVGPDNGLLSWALARETIRAIHSLENKSYFLPKVSATFHGRDIFAPVAARLSQGVPLQRLGPRLTSYVGIEWPEPKPTGHGLQGEVMYLDHFGNAITNISAREIGSQINCMAVFVRGRRVGYPAPSYQAVAPGRPVSIVGSSGFVEIAVNNGSAAKLLRLRVGAKVELRTQRAGK